MQILGPYHWIWGNCVSDIEYYQIILSNIANLFLLAIGTEFFFLQTVLVDFCNNYCLTNFKIQGMNIHNLSQNKLQLGK